MARRRDQLAELAGLIEKAGGVVAFAPADVADREQTLAAIHELAGRLGPVDLLVANAGVGAPTLFDPMNIHDIEKMVRVNLLGVVYSIEAVLPEMLRRRSGHLAAVSSMASYKGLPGESAYCASKAGLNAYMEGLRIQLREHAIAVTTICPGFVRTPMTDRERIQDALSGGSRRCRPPDCAGPGGAEESVQLSLADDPDDEANPLAARLDVGTSDAPVQQEAADAE